MRLEQRREIGSIILFSLVIILIPLIVYGVFPGGIVFSALASRVYWLFLFELVWYSIVLLIALRLSSGWLIFFEALICIFYRLALGVIFGLLIVLGDRISGSRSDLPGAVVSGIWSYAPAVIIQVFAAPFILKGFFSQMLSWGMGKREILEEIPKQDVRARKTDEKELIQPESTLEAEEMDLGSPLRYIKEYSGVEGAFLVDSEGLIIAKELGQEMDGEKLAPFMVGLEELNNKALKKIDEKKVSRIELYTPTRWISLTRIFGLVLVTVANRHTDDLLSVRIVQASEMIRRYMRKRYTQEILSEVEEQKCIES